MAAAASRARIGRGGDVTPPPTLPAAAPPGAPLAERRGEGGGVVVVVEEEKGRQSPQRLILQRAGKKHGRGLREQGRQHACPCRGSGIPRSSTRPRRRRRTPLQKQDRPSAPPAFYRCPPDRRRCGAGPQGPPSAGGPRPLLRPDFILLLLRPLAHPPTRPPNTLRRLSGANGQREPARAHRTSCIPDNPAPNCTWATLRTLRPSPSPPWFLMAGARKTPCTG